MRRGGSRLGQRIVLDRHAETPGTAPLRPLGRRRRGQYETEDEGAEVFHARDGLRSAHANGGERLGAGRDSTPAHEPTAAC